MSRRLPRAEDTQSMQNFVGPIRYMAPESLIRGEYSSASDSFMYANFLYELLFRRVPFDETPNLLDVAERIRCGERPILTDDTDPIFLTIFKSCWSVDPADRLSLSQIVVLFQHLDEPDMSDPNLLTPTLPTLTKEVDHYEIFNSF